MASSKRQTTMAKMMREQAVRERRARKQAALEQATDPEHAVPAEPADDRQT